MGVLYRIVDGQAFADALAVAEADGNPLPVAMTGGLLFEVPEERQSELNDLLLSGVIRSWEEELGEAARAADRDRALEMARERIAARRKAARARAGEGG